MFGEGVFHCFEFPWISTPEITAQHATGSQARPAQTKKIVCVNRLGHAGIVKGVDENEIVPCNISV